jgi:hypothetical protein
MFCVLGEVDKSKYKKWFNNGLSYSTVDYIRWPVLEDPMNHMLQCTLSYTKGKFF